MSDANLGLLRAALVDRSSARAFGADDVRRVSADLFYGHAPNAFERDMYKLTVNNADEGVKNELTDFIELVRTQQAENGEYMHKRIADTLAKRGDRISASAANRSGIQLTIAGSVVPAVPDDSPEAVCALHDLAIALLLRFGAFDDAGSGQDKTLVGADLVLAFLFDGVDYVNAAHLLYNSIGEIMASPHGDVAEANKSLLETRRLEGVVRSVNSKTQATLTEARLVLFEAWGTMILTVTLMVAAWFGGAVVMSNHRGIALAASVFVMVYVLARMVWVHSRPQHEFSKV